MTSTHLSTPDLPTPGGEAPRRGATWKRYGVLVLLLTFAAFWTWALFFASKQAVNKIGDREWAARAERICAAATVEREALADFTRIDRPTPELIASRADVVDAATDVLERMLDDVMATAPTDPKGAAIVPDWSADYRTYLADRRAYADELRASDVNLPFYETAAGTIPVSEKVATFAGDNEMPSCAPPRDLS
jgi:hypothetical protein